MTDKKYMGDLFVKLKNIADKKRLYEYKEIEKKLSINSDFRILGIDQSFTGTGWAIMSAVKKGESIEIKPIKTGLISTPKDDPLLKRMQDIRYNIELLIDAHKPDVISIETPLLRAFSAHKLNGLYYILLDMFSRHKISVITFHPLKLKNLILEGTTVTGKLKKSHITTAAKTKFNLNKVNNNIADAMFLAWFGMRFTLYRKKLITNLTENEQHIFSSEKKNKKGDLIGMIHHPNEIFFDFNS